MVDLARAHNRLYERICGVHPHMRPWHYQWLSVCDLYRDFRRVLPGLRGRVLDVGCQDKPYGPWLSGVDAHLGLDIEDGPHVDYVVKENGDWPVDEASVDAVLCTQVLMYVPDPGQLIAQADRALRPGGRLVFTVPFAYQDHPTRPDYWRWSRVGVAQVLPPGYEIEELEPQGRAGSTIGNLALAWIHMAAHRNPVTRAIKAALLPVWVLFCGLVNGLARIFDCMDGTRLFYHNVLVVARKPGDVVASDVVLDA